MAMRKKPEPTTKFAVVGIREFVNGEHHWMAPVAEMHDAESFGMVGLDEYDKPVFGSLKDAEDWAAALAVAEWELAACEKGRPLFLVVEDSALVETIERDEYPYPSEAEAWSDERAADFERQFDCDVLASKALWDSRTDEESILAHQLGYAAELEKMPAGKEGRSK